MIKTELSALILLLSEIFFVRLTSKYNFLGLYALNVHISDEIPFYMLYLNVT